MKATSGTAGAASHGSAFQLRFREVRNSTSNAAARKMPETRTVQAHATRIEARAQRPCRAASQAGKAKAQNSASVYAAARNTPMGAAYQSRAARGPMPSSANSCLAIRARKTPANALATSETRTPPAVGG